MSENRVELTAALLHFTFTCLRFFFRVDEIMDAQINMRIPSKFVQMKKDFL